MPDIKLKDRSGNTSTYSNVNTITVPLANESGYMTFYSQSGITPSGTKTISISSNGTITEDVTTYSQAQIITNVPGVVPTGTKTINIYSNGTVTSTVSGYQYAKVITNVPNTYSAADFRKVVMEYNGSYYLSSQEMKIIVTQNTSDYLDTRLVAGVSVNVSNTFTSADAGKVITSEATLSTQTSTTILTNGVYNTTYNNSVTVSVPGIVPSGTILSFIDRNGYFSYNAYSVALVEVNVGVPEGYPIQDGDEIWYLCFNALLKTVWDDFLVLLDDHNQYSTLDSSTGLYFCALGLNLRAYKLPNGGGFNGGYLILCTNPQVLIYSTSTFDASSIVPGFKCETPGFMITCIRYYPGIIADWTTINSWFASEILKNQYEAIYSSQRIAQTLGPTTNEPDKINFVDGDSFTTLYFNTNYDLESFLTLLPYTQSTVGGLTITFCTLAFTDQITLAPQLQAIDLAASGFANSGYALYWAELDPGTGNVSVLDILYSTVAFSVPALGINITTPGWQVEKYTPTNTIVVNEYDNTSYWIFWNIANQVVSKNPICFGYKGGYTTQTITGTLDNTFGNSFSDFYTAYTQGKAQAIIVIDPSALGMSQVQGIVWGNVTNGADLANGMAFDVSWDGGDGSLVAAQILQSGTITDITSYASVITTILNIMWLN